MSVDEGAQFLASYFDEVIKRHGKNALDRFWRNAPRYQPTLERARNEAQIRQTQTKAERRLTSENRTNWKHWPQRQRHTRKGVSGLKKLLAARKTGPPGIDLEKVLGSGRQAAGRNAATATARRRVRVRAAQKSRHGESQNRKSKRQRAVCGSGRV